MTKHIWHSPSCCYLQNIWCVSRFYFAFVPVLPQTHTISLAHQITLYSRRAHLVFLLVPRYASPLSIFWFSNESPLHIRELEKKRKQFSNFRSLRSLVFLSSFLFSLSSSSFSLHFGFSIFKNTKIFFHFVLYCCHCRFSFYVVCLFVIVMIVICYAFALLYLV